MPSDSEQTVTTHTVTTSGAPPERPRNLDPSVAHRLDVLEQASQTSVADRLRVIETATAVQGAQIQDHERVLTALEGHLATLVDEFAKTRNRVLLLAVGIVVTNPHVLALIGLSG